MRFSHPSIWIGNALTQGVSFLFVAELIVRLDRALCVERSLSRTDGLTGLLNARAFYSDAGLLLSLSRRKCRPVSLAYLDLDNFKAVNDTLGHQAGDATLQRVAEVLRECTRESDLAARLGGDEFVVLLADTGPEEARVTLERLHDRLAGALGSVGTREVSGSLGAVTYLSAPTTVDELVRDADTRMYAAKAAGKNRVLLEVLPGSPATNDGCCLRVSSGARLDLGPRGTESTVSVETSVDDPKRIPSFVDRFTSYVSRSAAAMAVCGPPWPSPVLS